MRERGSGTPLCIATIARGHVGPISNLIVISLGTAAIIWFLLEKTVPGRQMAAIGEESGALDSMLFKVAEFYEEEVSNAVDSLASLLEPMIMVVIGGMVGSMVIGMYLPIFKLAGAV